MTRDLTIAALALIALTGLLGCRPSSAAPASRRSAETRSWSFDKAYRWKRRPLLLFPRAAKDKRYLAQRRALTRQSCERRQREVVVLVLPKQGRAWASDGAPIDVRRARRLRRRFRPQRRPLDLVLIGKDGGVKLQARMPLAPTALWARIDRMPMRRREMRGQAPCPPRRGAPRR